MRPTRALARANALTPTVRAALASAAATADAGPSQATVNGWVRSVRAHKNVAFAEVDDGSGDSVQAVLKGRTAEGITLGSSVRLSGTLSPSRGRGQALELQVSDARVLGPSDPDAYPIQKKALPAPLLREHAHMRFRTTQTAGVMRVRDALARDWHDWFEDHEFVHVHTPILTSSDCEGAGEVFTLSQSLPGPEGSPAPFFPRPTNLAVSGQLHLEAPTHALGRTYTLSPAFRAEPSMTSRHLAEFYMLEAEVAFVDTLDGLLDVAEAAFRGVLSRLLAYDSRRATRARADLAKIAQTLAAEQGEGESGGEGEAAGPLDHLLAAATTPFARITYTDAVALLADEHAVVPFEHAPTWGDGLSSEHEKWLAGTHFNGPVFVTDYPAALKPFYMLPSGPEAAAAAHGPTVACFDLLFPGIGEMAGGSMREHNLDALRARMAASGLSEHEYDWYLDLRRFGSVPHGGWGMGWERWVCWVTGVGNVRDVVAFPRWAGSCRF
ncbi:putative asparagine--tRNA ligase, mitochondrial [Vanrija pseudolonga]|uniref:asparagine--tRNA ligase n=1 Tax=Vanrija pseudolonga TaxID=143232 RepID=A0AAF0XZC7_9TREE|nr:putative asparagine--tRNA ligase, mitochondrial [Vanrija pseudolonga]